MTTKQDTNTRTRAIEAAEGWLEAKADEREAQKVLDAAKKRRKAHADTLVMLGYNHGDTVTVYNNRRMTFTVHTRTSLPYKAALEAVRPMLDGKQERVVQSQLDFGASVSRVMGLKNAK